MNLFLALRGMYNCFYKLKKYELNIIKKSALVNMCNYMPDDFENNSRGVRKKLTDRACQVFFDKGESMLSSFAADVSQIGWAILLRKSVDVSRKHLKKDGIVPITQVASRQRMEGNRKADGKGEGEGDCSIQDLSGFKRQELTVGNLGAFSAPVLSAAAALSALLAGWTSFQPVARLPVTESFASASLGSVQPPDKAIEASLLSDMPLESMGRAALAASLSVSKPQIGPDLLKKPHEPQGNLQGRTKLEMGSKMQDLQAPLDKKNDPIRLEKEEAANRFVKMSPWFVGQDRIALGKSLETGMHNQEEPIAALKQFDSLSSLKPKEIIRAPLRDNLSVDLRSDRGHLDRAARLEQGASISLQGMEPVKAPLQDAVVETIGSSSIAVSERGAQALKEALPACFSRPLPQASPSIPAQQKGMIADERKIFSSLEFLPLKKSALVRVGTQESSTSVDAVERIGGVGPVVDAIRYAADQPVVQNVSIEPGASAEIVRPADVKKIEAVNVEGFDRRAQMTVEDVNFSKKGVESVERDGVNAPKAALSVVKGQDVLVQEAVRSLGNGFIPCIKGAQSAFSVVNSVLIGTQVSTQEALGRLTGSLMALTASVLSQVKERCNVEKIGKGSSEISLSTSVAAIPAKTAIVQASEPEVIVRKYAPLQIIENYHGNQQVAL